MSSPVRLEPRRHLPFVGTYNVRDIGGYLTSMGVSTRWFTLFRADSLHRLSPADQAILLDHGLRVVIDLRRPDELQAAPNVFANSSKVSYRHISLLGDTPPIVRGDPQPLVETYRYILDQRQAQVREVLAILAAPEGLPALVHCTAGKDRTGVIVALLLGLVGVVPETIVSDYVLTSTYLNDAFMTETRQRALQRGFTWEQYAPLVGCPPEHMLVTLTHLDVTYGGIEAYVRAIGLTDQHIARLRLALVDQVIAS
jgi:protein-tyrosine phosphatase